MRELFKTEQGKYRILSFDKMRHFPLAAPGRLELSTLRLTAACSGKRTGLYGKIVKNSAIISTYKYSH